MSLLNILWTLLKPLLAERADLVLEILALRQQLALYHREKPRPKLDDHDRGFWVWLSEVWQNWRSALVVVTPDTVVRWHRQGFKYYWRWKSKGKPGRPQLSREIIDLIQRLARENPTWGAPRIQSELRLLGHEVAESTVSKYIIRDPKPPSQTWRTFLLNHVPQIAACDFFVVPTVTFQLLYVFVIMRHDRRRIVHFNVTTHPTAAWTAQQITEAFPFDEAPRFLLHDRDSIYGEEFHEHIANMGIEEVKIAPRSPWQNPYCERLIGSIRRDCLDHMIVLNEAHLRKLLHDYFTYYHEARTHLSLQRNAPNPREVELPEKGDVTAVPYLGGLHHRYRRAA